jgi:hypothetical protein
MLSTRALVVSLVVSLGVVAAIVGCRANTEPLGPPAMVLRAYEVPQGQAQELRNIVSSLLYQGENVPRLGNVVVAPTGQLLVSAPATFHNGVQELLGAVRAAP